MISAIPTHTVTFTRPTFGTITGSGIDCGTSTSDCTEDFLEGSTPQFTLAYDSGTITFTGWSGDATGTDNPLTVTVDADKDIGVDLIAIEKVSFPWNLFLPAIIR